MNRYLRIFLRNAGIISIPVILTVLYTISFFIYNTPFKRFNYDSYTQLGQLELVRHGELYSPELYPGLFKDDLRMILYPKVWAQIGETLNIESSNILFINGIANILLVFISSYYLGSKLFKRKSGRILLFIVLYLFSIAPLWSQNDMAYTIFSLPDLMINAFYPQNFANTLYIVLIALLISSKLNKRIILFINLIVLICLLAHLFTGILSILTIVIISVVEYILGNDRKQNIILVVSVSFTALLTLLLPNFNWLAYILSSATNLQTSPIAQGIANDTYYSITTRASILGMLVIGATVVFKNLASLKMKVINFFYIFIGFSFVLPFKIPYFWRFTNFARLPLAYLTVLFFDQLYFRKFILILFLFFTMFSSRLLFERNINGYTEVPTAEFLKGYKNSVFLADELESNYIQSFGNNQVYVIPNGHITNGTLLNMNTVRLNKLNQILQGDAAILENLVNDNKIDFLLINKRSVKYNYKDILLNIKYKIETENEKYILYKTR